jgi:hypothetical protein
LNYFVKFKIFRTKLIFQTFLKVFGTNFIRNAKFKWKFFTQNFCVKKEIKPSIGGKIICLGEIISLGDVICCLGEVIIGDVIGVVLPMEKIDITSVISEFLLKLFDKSDISSLDFDFSDLLLPELEIECSSSSFELENALGDFGVVFPLRKVFSLLTEFSVASLTKPTDLLFRIISVLSL